MRDEEGKSRGFGFVCFKDSAGAQKAIDTHGADRVAADRPDNESKALYVAEAKSKEQRQLELAKSTYQWKRSMQLLNLIVRNIDPHTTKEEFDEYFANFGEVRSTKLIPESSLGFVCFKEREAARRAKDCNNLMLRGREITVAFCEPKESRMKHLEEKWDKRSYERHRNASNKTNNQDVLTLITSLSLLMGQLQNQGGQPRMNNSRPFNNNGRPPYGQGMQVNGHPHPGQQAPPQNGHHQRAPYNKLSMQP